MRFSVALLATGLVACSSASSSSANGGDAGSDSLSSDVATDAGVDTAPRFTPCGGPPYVTFHAKVGQLNFSGTGGVLPGASIAFDTCPGVTIETDASGEAFASLQRGVPFTATFTAPDHITVIAAEQLVGADESIDELRLVESLPNSNADSILVGYSATTPAFALVIEPRGSTCNGTDRVVIKVAGAQSHYMSPAWPPDTRECPGIVSCPPDMGSSGPVVFFTGLAAGDVTTVTTSRIGCNTALSVPPLHQTGRFKLANGAWTVGNVAVLDP